MNMAGNQGDMTGARTMNGSAGSTVATQAAPGADPRAESQISVIGADIVVTGNIEAQVDLHIEGRVLGDVRCATLILGEKSSVTGSIYAQRVRVSGTVEGAVETRDLAIESGARVQGDVTYSRIRIANGGVVEGNMVYRPVDEEGAEANRLTLVQEANGKPPSPAKVHYFE